jgi:peptidoglycan/LPS O-acetylase OafA/YrhL
VSVPRIRSLDGLRSISISLVVFSHLVKWHQVSGMLAEGYGALGVHMFFVLSGYLITNLLLREYEHTGTVNLGDFYARRAFRIFPAAFVFLGIVIALYWREVHWYHVLAASLYLANMDIGRPWMFGHLWSLSIEEQFYLLWPFAVKQWHRSRTTILLCVILLTPVFADQLAIGCLLAILAPRIPHIRKYIALTMVVAVIFVPWFPANSPGRTLFMLFVLRPLLDVSLAGLVLHVIQVPYRALSWTPVVWLGRISYSLYLWQELFCSNRAFHSGYFLLLPALGSACLSYYFVEKPMLRVREWYIGKRSHTSNGAVVENPPSVRHPFVCAGQESSPVPLDSGLAG